MINEIGIVDSKRIISIFKNKYEYDYSEYATTAFKRRLVSFLNTKNFNSIKDFILRLEDDSRLFDQFYEYSFVKETEMFRDPSLWRELRDKYFADLVSARDTKIWLTNATTGDELFTIAIVLAEMGIASKVKIIVSVGNENILNQIKNGGAFDLRKIEISEANYLRFFGKENFSKYFEVKGSKAYFDLDLIKNVDFKIHSLVKDEPISSFKMVFCRNGLIYFNPSLHEKVAKKLVDSVMAGGFLILGSNETMDCFSEVRKLNLLNTEEKIYKKRLN